MALSRFLPARVALYADLFQAAADAFQLPPETIAALCDRETLCGTAKELDMPGPNGTGDFGARDAKRWGFMLPPDGRGWGRGLIQIDFGSHAPWCALKNGDVFVWTQPKDNIFKGAEILAANLKALGTLPAAICAYNAGQGHAMRALGEAAASGGDVVAALDAATTGGNYVSDVLKRMASFSDTVTP